MNMLSFRFVFPLIISLIAVIVTLLYFRKKPKVDRGFTIFYYKLSYRRRYKRTLIVVLPLSLIVSFIIMVFADLPLIHRLGAMALILSITAFQAGYNYYQWQKSSRR